MKRRGAVVVSFLAALVPLTAAQPAEAVTWPAVSATFSDPAGDGRSGVDLVAVGAAYRGGGVTLTATTATLQLVDPAAWASADQAVIWGIDTTGQGVDDYDVMLFSDGSKLVAEVFRTDSEEVVCDALVEPMPRIGIIGTTPPAFVVHFPAECVGAPAAFGLAAVMGSNTSGVDAAPDSGWGMAVTHTAGRSGYWMLGKDGAVYPFGDAARYGAPTFSVWGGFVDLEPTPDGAGYWLLGGNGMVFSQGNAHPFIGAMSKLNPGESAASVSTTPTGAGMWIFTDRGRVLPFGDATSYGDMSSTTLNGPILDSIVTPTGNGYYMVASDGGIFAFGDAVFHGSMGAAHLNAPVQSLVPDPDGAGYWLVASDGGVFAFQAGFRGSMGNKTLNKPVTGMVPYGNGYLMVGEDGGIFNFSDKPFSGSLGANPPSAPIVSVAVLDES